MPSHRSAKQWGHLAQSNALSARAGGRTLSEGSPNTNATTTHPPAAPGIANARRLRPLTDPITEPAASRDSASTDATRSADSSTNTIKQPDQHG